MPPRRKAAAAAKKAKALDKKGDDDVTVQVKKSMQEQMKKSSQKRKAEKSASKSVAVKVDPLCPIANKAEIFNENGEAWECMLNQTNIQNNNNKYFLIQLLKDSSGNFFTWFRWGRVGYNGQNSLNHHFGNLEAAKSTFMKKFSDKTKNNWDDRKKFKKVSGKYDLVEVQIACGDTEEVDGPVKKSKKEIKILESKLDVKVQELLKMICDTKIMEQTLKGLDFDVDKSPLGKVTEEQIKAGYKALSKIADIVNKNDSRKSLLEACNEFYTRIPHYFGMKVPPLIATLDEIKSKIELLEALNDIQLGIKAMKEEVSEEEEEKKEVANPIDTQYTRLNVKLEALDHESSDFELIEKYIQSTHGSTHTSYKMAVEDVFVCEKDCLSFKDKGNRMLLFHGSRMSNFAGILSQGLKIAPPEAPVTGYMFGKGCYFADMASKSANYCFATPSKPHGLLLLCEVSLGTSNELLQADYNANKMPKGRHSVKGVGRFQADAKNTAELQDGTVVPLGPVTSQDVPGGSLIYNEYIVYDTTQVRLRYLAKIKFVFDR